VAEALCGRRPKKVKLAMRFKGAAPLERKASRLEVDQFQSKLEEVGRFSMPMRRWVASGMGGGWADASSALHKAVVPRGGLRSMRGMDALSMDDLVVHFASVVDAGVLVGVSGVQYDRDGGIVLQGGEVLLLEAQPSKFGPRLKEQFQMVVTVGEKPPPMKVKLSPLDPFRPALAVLGLLVTVVFAALELAPLDAVAIIVALVSLLLGTLSGQDLYRSINGPVLLTVAASFGAGAAIFNTGLATCLASGVLFVAESGGPPAILAALLGLALTLGVFVSNNTVVVLLAPLIRDLCERQNMSLKMAMLSVIYAANLSFATPFSYQTNMMVMEHGNYVFIDYVKFGVPMMIVCGIVALICTFLYWGGDK
jgi:hypothetical protein